MADVNSEATDGGCEMCEVRDAGEKKENGVTATAHSFWIFGLWPATTTCPIRGRSRQGEAAGNKHDTEYYDP